MERKYNHRMLTEPDKSWFSLLWAPVRLTHYLDRYASHLEASLKRCPVLTDANVLKTGEIQVELEERSSTWQRLKGSISQDFLEWGTQNGVRIGDFTVYRNKISAQHPSISANNLLRAAKWVNKEVTRWDMTPVYQLTNAAWEDQKRFLLHDVSSGKRSVVGLINSPLAKDWTVIPEGRFRYFTIVDWKQGIAEDEKSGDRVYSIHVYPREAHGLATEAEPLEAADTLPLGPKEEVLLAFAAEVYPNGKPLGKSWDMLAGEAQDFAKSKGLASWSVTRTTVRDVLKPHWNRGSKAEAEKLEISHSFADTA